MDKEIRDLEELLRQAVSERRSAPKSPDGRARALAARARSHFTDPDNWSLRQQVQLVHREGNIETLVGIFDDFRHAWVAGARRLIAAQLNPNMKPAIEYVYGDHWIGQALEAKRRTPDQVLELCEDLVLDCGPVAHAAVVSVSLAGGGVSRVCLCGETVFDFHTPRTILLLPRGMDVLEGLTRGTKERIWMEVQRQLKLEEPSE